MEHQKALLMGGADSTYHDFDSLLPVLHELLEKQGLDVTTSEDTDLFLPAHIREFDLVVCYTLGHTLNPEQEEGLLAAVRGDPWDGSAKTKGFLGIHGAACSFLNSAPYLRMLGGKFLVHPPLGPLEIEIVRPKHPVMQGVTDFHIEDELYLLESRAPFEPLAVCHYEGFPRPVVWVKPYGLGKVVYISLGHGQNQLENKSLQKILTNAAAWILNE